MESPPTPSPSTGGADLPVPVEQFVPAVHAVAPGVRPSTVRVYPGVVDRTSWPPGPWDHEPDKVTWVDDLTGYDLMIRRTDLGALCGYVGLPPGHPLHGHHYGDEHPLLRGLDPDYPDNARADSVLHVHGGVTFSGPCDRTADDGPNLAAALCHVPLPGRPGNVWWVGFDCAHVFDVVPGLPGFGPDALAAVVAYRDLAYVASQCRDLARQLLEVAHLAIGEGP